MRPIIAITAALLLFESGSAPALDNISGPWKGSLSSRMKDSYAHIIMTITQSGEEISGRFICEGVTLKCYGVGGSLVGRLKGSDFTATLRYPDNHLCGLSGKLTEATLQGEYSCDDKFDEDRGYWQIKLDTPDS